MEPRSSKLVGEVVRSEPLQSSHAKGSSTVRIVQPEPAFETPHDPAAVLLAHLFASGDRNIPGIAYAVAYRLAEANSGGDIVDVYQFDNDSVAMSIADISGKGAQAAVHAALIKYGLRAYASHGLTPEKTMRAMDRLYLENCTFENIESFATVFCGIVDSGRRIMSYANAGHEPVIVVHPHMDPQILPPTAPIIGVFDDQHHLFRQRTIELWPGTLLVATTDGVTEIRNPSGEFFGVDRLCDCVEEHRTKEPSAISDAIVEEVAAFSRGPLHDDLAILVARFV